MPLTRPSTGRLRLGAAVPWWRRSGGRTGRWLLAVALAAVAAGLVVVRTDEADRTLAGLGRTRSVLVAQRELVAGHVIGEGDVVARTLPVGAVPESAIDAAAGSIDGRTVTAAILAGEPVSARRLAPDGVDGLAALVPPDHRAVAIPVTGTGLQVRVGDRVDVLAPADAAPYDDDPSTRADAVAGDALVIAVADGTVTLAVDRDDAPAVARALAGGTPVLALHGADPDD